MNFTNNFISFMSIARKESWRVLRIWKQALMPPIITMSLYLMIFGKFIGSQINDIQGFSYIEFIVPGIIMMSVITNSYSNVASSFFGARFQKSIEELIVSPSAKITIVLGYVAGGMTRGLAVGILVTLASLFFTQLQIYNIAFVFIFVILTSLVFSLAGIINGIFAKRFDDIAIIPTFVLTPLTYLSGVFYSIAFLPEIWQNLSKLNPILYMVNGFRYGFLGISDINVWFALCMLIVFVIVLFGINVYLLKKGIGIKN